MTARDFRTTRKPASPRRRASDALEQLVATQAREIEAANARLRALIDNEPECVKLLDAKGRLIEMNTAGLKMIEVDELEQVLGEVVYGIVAPEHREAFRKLTERVCRGERGSLEFEIIGMKGTRRWLETRAVPFYDAAHAGTVLLGITRDISEQKRAEQAQHESEARFRSLVELSSDWYWEQDENCRFVSGSAGMQAIMDLSVAADLGKTRWELPLVGPSQEQWDEHRATLAAHRPFRDFEYQRLNELGRPVWISVSGEPIFDAEGRFRGYRGVGRNITQRKLSEHALRASEQRFRLFMENAPAMAWTKDSDRRVTWVNRGYERARGVRLADLLGRTDSELFPPEFARRVREQDDAVLQTGSPLQYANRVPGADGTIRDYVAVRFPLPDATGRPGLGGIAVDVSESRQLQQSVRELHNRLVSAQEDERRRVAGDLHDMVGQKLTALGIGLDILRQALGTEPAPTGAMARLAEMSALVEETIGTTRALMTQLHPTALDDHGLSAALYQYAAAFEARTGLRVQVIGEKRPVPLPRDIALALFRIAQEALTNAAKHSGASLARIRVSKSPRRVEVCVEDDGRGMRPRPADSSGGWGVPAMRERAEAVGGKLEISSSGKGTRINVRVPLGNDDTDHSG